MQSLHFFEMAVRILLFNGHMSYCYVSGPISFIFECYQNEQLSISQVYLFHITVVGNSNDETI